MLIISMKKMKQMSSVRVVRAFPSSRLNRFSSQVWTIKLVVNQAVKTNKREMEFLMSEELKLRYPNPLKTSSDLKSSNQWKWKIIPILIQRWCRPRTAITYLVQREVPLNQPYSIICKWTCTHLTCRMVLMANQCAFWEVELPHTNATPTMSSRGSSSSKKTASWAHFKMKAGRYTHRIHSLPHR